MKCRKCKKPLPDAAAFCPWCGISQTSTRRHRKRGNGQGSAYKRGRFWTAVVTLPHEPHTKGKRVTKGGFPTERDAILYCPTLIRVATEKKDPPKRGLTVQHYYDIYSGNALSKLSNSKQVAYNTAWKRFEAIKDRTISSLTVADLQELIDGRTYYPARDIKALLSHIYKLAVADQQATTNLSEYVTLPELDERETLPLNAEELVRIWDAYDNGDKVAPYLLLMTYSSMMPGELFGCVRGMIDREHCEIHGAGLKTSTRKETPIVYPTYITPVVDRILSFTATDPDQKIVAAEKWTFYELFKAFKTERKIRPAISLYSCRHSTGTALTLETDTETSVVQKVMRHKNYKSTLRYVHPDTKDMHAAVNSIPLPKRKKNPSL